MLDTSKKLKKVVYKGVEFEQVGGTGIVDIKPLIIGTWIVQVESAAWTLTFNNDNTVISRFYENDVLDYEYSGVYTIDGYIIAGEGDGDTFTYDINTNTVILDADGTVFNKVIPTVNFQQLDDGSYSLIITTK